MNMNIFVISFLSIMSFLFSPYLVESADDTVKSYLSKLGIHEFSSHSEAPDFNLLDLNDKRITLKEFRGKVVFLHIWATWCKPCMEEMPYLQILHERFKGDNFVVLAVSIDREGAEVVKPYTEKYRLTFPVLLSEDGNLNKSYWTWGIPSSYLIDREGKIIGRALGPRNWAGDDAIGLIEKLCNMHP